MPTVADVVRRYGPGYLARFGAAVPAAHRRVLHAVAACRTGELGTVVFACSACGRRHHVGRSCGDRHCPTCQQARTRAWVERETARLLPCPYFLITFTLPAELRRFVRSHQRVCYAALFEASSWAIRRLAADPRFVGTPSPASSACSTPGGAPWSTTRTSTTWSPAEAPARTESAGFPPGPTSSSR
ncbi:MAG: transposase zinc-binding domain-containing protein [Longimicrobiaceae bacterium]